MDFAADDKDAKKTARVMLQMIATINLEKAKGDHRKVVELHPDDTWAKQQVDSLSSAQQ